MIDHKMHNHFLLVILTQKSLHRKKTVIWETLPSNKLSIMWKNIKASVKCFSVRQEAGTSFNMAGLTHEFFLNRLLARNQFEWNRRKNKNAKQDNGNIFGTCWTKN